MVAYHICPFSVLPRILPCLGSTGFPVAACQGHSQSNDSDVSFITTSYNLRAPWLVQQVQRVQSYTGASTAWRMRSNSEVTSAPRRLWTGSGTDGSTWDGAVRFGEYRNASNGKTMENALMKPYETQSIEANSATTQSTASGFGDGPTKDGSAAGGGARLKPVVPKERFPERDESMETSAKWENRHNFNSITWCRYMI